MIWKVLFPAKKTVLLPARFNEETMLPFLSQIVDEQKNTQCSELVFDFSRLEFVDPVGVVILSNVIEYFRQIKCRVSFANHNSNSDGLKFLDDAGFFLRYLKKSLSSSSKVRSTTLPLNLIHESEVQQYLLMTLMPWIGATVGMRAESLSSIRVSLEEVLHNVRDHSGVKVGCTFAQHFPNRNRLQVAISDFGHGIPEVVRRVEKNLQDPAAIRRACQEGFTTKSNVVNRGAGLPTLINYVTRANGGNVLIASGKGKLSAVPLPHGPLPYKIATSTLRGFYPGTLVRVILRTDTLELAAEDAEIETFSW